MIVTSGEPPIASARPVALNWRLRSANSWSTPVPQMRSSGLCPMPLSSISRAVLGGPTMTTPARRYWPWARKANQDYQGAEARKQAEVHLKEVRAQGEDVTSVARSLRSLRIEENHFVNRIEHLI